MGSSNRNVFIVCIPDGSGVCDVKKGIKYHIQRREKKEAFIRTIKVLIVAIGIAVVLGIIIASYLLLLHKAGFA